jgi:hypothetical protein
MTSVMLPTRSWRDLPSALAALIAQEFGLPLEPEAPGDHPALAWRRSGLMAITGRSEGKPLIAPVALTTLADSALSLLETVSGRNSGIACGAQLLGARARMMGLRRGGAVSANGSCRILQCGDGHIALNLPRADDWDLIPALLEGDGAGSWDEVARSVITRPSEILVERARMLGLACAAVAPSLETPPFHVAHSRAGEFPGRQGRERPVVVDLSVLWAGPLAGALLASCGAQVVKVQSIGRPDGALKGHAGFYSSLNGGKAERWIDFTSDTGRAELRALIDGADIVIESSRPRALRQLGIEAEEVAAKGATWVSITAHGRYGFEAHRIGFGDDAAMSGGLGQAMAAVWNEPLFAGDAIADPLTGILAALLAWTGWMTGGGGLISLALADVVRFACRYGATDIKQAQEWQRLAEADGAPLYPF